MKTNNPIHGALFFSGILHKGCPGSYNMVFAHSYEEKVDISEVYYMRALRLLITDPDKIPNKFKEADKVIKEFNDKENLKKIKGIEQ